MAGMENSDLDIANLDDLAFIFWKLVNGTHMEPVLGGRFRQRRHGRYCFGPVGGSLLSAFIHHFNHRIAFVTVDKALKVFASLGIPDDGCPFTLVGANQFLHLVLELGRDAQVVFHHDFAKILDTAFHLLKPAGRTGQLVGRHDVVHQETVEVLDSHLLGYVGDQEFGMLRLGAAVTADIDVVTLVCRNTTKIFALPSSSG